MDRFYRVTGSIFPHAQRGRRKSYAIDVLAPSAKVAMDIARSKWRRDSHLLLVSANRLDKDSLPIRIWFITGAETPSGWVSYKNEEED